jgi:hypothetical protein
MARPEKNTVPYFPFICEEGKKMYYIEETYGNDGFAVYVKILRELAKTDYHYLDLSQPTTMMFLSSKCKVKKDVLEVIINDIAALGMYDEKLWTENKIIWCQYFIDNIQEAYSKRNNNCMTYDGLLHLLDSLGIRKLPKGKSKVPIKPQSRVEYSIEEDRREEESSTVPAKKIPEFEDFFKYALENKPNVDKESVRLKYKSFVENDWKDGNNKPIKNWKSKVLNVLPYLKEANKQTSSGGNRGASL